MDNALYWTVFGGIIAAGIVAAEAVFQWLSSKAVLQVFERELPLKVDDVLDRHAEPHGIQQRFRIAH